MRILKVSLFNINSLKGAHSVDFDAEPLASAGLFAITGATGAPLSTTAFEAHLARRYLD